MQHVRVLNMYKEESQRWKGTLWMHHGDSDAMCSQS